jgi:hypothetical protein
MGAHRVRVSLLWLGNCASRCFSSSPATKAAKKRMDQRAKMAKMFVSENRGPKKQQHLVEEQ